MQERVCHLCGRRCFVDWDGPNPTCYPCFKEGRGWAFNKTDESLAAIQGRYTEAMLAVDTLRRREQPARPPIDSNRLEQLIRLCHPDRHDGRELANEVTAWLLSIRSGNV